MSRLLRSDFVRHSALVFAATMLINVLNYVFNFVLSRRLGVEHYATLAALVGIIMILSIPGTAINLIAVKYGAEYHALGDVPRLRRLSTKMFGLTGIVAGACFIIGILLQSRIAAFLKIENDFALTAMLAVVALGVVAPSARGVLQGCQDFRRLSVSTAVEALLKLVLAVALVALGYGVRGAMSGWLLGTAIALAYAIFAVRIHFGERGAVVRLSLETRTLINTIGGVTAVTAILTLMSFMDVVLVKHYFSAHDAGIYSAANLTGKIVLFVVGFLPTVLLPKVIATAKRGEAPLGLLGQAVLSCTLILALILIAFSVRPAFIVSIVAGKAFVDAAPYVLQYDVAMGLLALLSIIVNFRIALHRFDFIVPLALVLGAEIVAIALHHATLTDVIHVLIVGNAVAIAASCLGLRHQAAVTLRVGSEAA